MGWGRRGFRVGGAGFRVSGGKFRVGSLGLGPVEKSEICVLGFFFVCLIVGTKTIEIVRASLNFRENRPRR